MTNHSHFGSARHVSRALGVSAHVLLPGRVLVFLAAALAIGGCSSDPETPLAEPTSTDVVERDVVAPDDAESAAPEVEVATDEGPVEVDVAIPFAVTVFDTPFECGVTYEGIGSTGAQIGFIDMRLYIHDVVLIDAEGTESPVTLDEDGIWQRDGVAMLDFEDGCENGTQQLNAAVKGRVLSGNYASIRFQVGVPPELNSSETVLEGRGSPLNQVAMFWSWKSGYKYLRLDGDAGPFRLHLGASGCTDDFTCSEMNIVEVTLTDYDLEAHEIVLDLGDLLAGTDVSQNTAGTAPGCMGESVDPDCSDIFKRIGLGSPEERTSWSVNTKAEAGTR